MSIDALRQELSYDPDTGVFRWLIPGGGRRVGGVAGGLNFWGYRRISFNGTQVFEHRMAHAYVTGGWPTAFIDHINGVRDDNRWVNLRPATKMQNGGNRRQANRGNKTSGLLGVSRHGERWQAQICVSGKQRYLGIFATPELAHDAYLTKKREHHEYCTI